MASLLPSVYKAMKVCPPVGHALWAEVTSGENAWAARKTACEYFGAQDEFWMWKPYMLASAGKPSLHGCYACTVYWVTGALWRKLQAKTT